MERDALRAVIGQLDIWWWGSVTMRMAGLTDDEFFWKPVDDAWCMTRRGDELFYEWPPGSQGEPGVISPVTTIAWRLSHVAEGCFMSRWHSYFGTGTIDWTAQPFPTNATDALTYLETWKQRWRDAVEAAGDEGLWRPVGDRERHIPIMQLGRDDPFIGVVMHMNREVMHHGAEICLLRDLYRGRNLP